jgi:putative ABC transport system ATP-binding protein
LNGKEIHQYNDNQKAQIRNREIGFIFQSFNLLKKTSVYKNIERPMLYANILESERRKKIMEALRIVNLEDKTQNLSNQLSGGQIQRVAIARALVMNPSILLADEPTGNLPSKDSHEIMQFFDHLNQKGNTIIVITHEEDIASYARRIITVKDGQIISDKQNKK